MSTSYPLLFPVPFCFITVAHVLRPYWYLCTLIFVLDCTLLKQDGFLREQVVNNYTTPLTVRALQRRCFQPRSAAASSPTVFYAVRLGHVPGIYTSWQEARPHTLGVHSDAKRFSSLKKAEEYMAKPTGPGNPLFDDPTANLFTNGPASWGVHITFPGSPETQALWGPVITSAARHPGSVPCGQPAPPGNLVPSIKPSPGFVRDAKLYLRTSSRGTIWSLIATIVSSSLLTAPSNLLPTRVL